MPSERATEIIENDLLRRALAGEQSAKDQIEAKDLLKKADKTTLALRDRASSGDKAAMAELRRIAAGTPTASAPTPAATGFSQAHVDKAVAAARAEERQRIRSVFASDASRGREQLAANLLAAPEGWAASDIIAKLPTVDAAMKAKASEESAAIWDKAYAQTPSGQAAARLLAAQEKAGASKPSAKAAPAATSTDAAWDRARAEVQGRTESDAIWDRANAKVEAQRQASNPLLAAHDKARGIAR